MGGQRLGYVRVSTVGQSDERQLQGERLERVFRDKASAKDTNRPALQEMLSFARAGDTVIVHSMDRLARNLDDLRGLVDQFTGNGVRIEFLKEGLSFSGDDTPMAKFLLSVMGAFGEFERALLKERQREGIAIAKKKGVYQGRKRVLSSEQVDAIKTRIKHGEKKTVLAKEYKISRETLYQYLRQTEKTTK